MRNLSECTGRGARYRTCYDGTHYLILSKENKGGMRNNGKKIYELTKQYSQTGFDDENSIGYAIDVYEYQ
jgi:hypothetical protein